MFPLHDRTRRWICRSGFLLGGVLPLLAVIGWSAAVRTAVYKESVRARLQTVLGLGVRFEAVTYPRPGVTLLSGLELLDPQTEEPLVKARLLEIGGDEQLQTLDVSQPEIDARGLDQLFAVLERCEHHAQESESAVRISTAELTLRWPQGVQTLADCTAHMDRIESGWMAEVAFRLAGAEPNSPAQLGLRCSTTADGDASTTLKLETGSTPLPCSLLAALAHRENWLGANSTFQGTVRAEETSGGRQIELSGVLAGMDLQSAIADHFPHHFTGTCTLAVERATIRDGRLEEATGTVHAGPGVVSRSLLRSAAESLRMRANSAAQSDSEIVPYEELAAAFAWDMKGLTLHGQCETSETGTVLRSAEGVLLAESSGGAAPVAALVQALVPDSRVQVPATRQTDWLLRALPLPEVQTDDPLSAPHARLRGGRDVH